MRVQDKTVEKQPRRATIGKQRELLLLLPLLLALILFPHTPATVSTSALFLLSSELFATSNNKSFGVGKQNVSPLYLRTAHFIRDPCLAEQPRR